MLIEADQAHLFAEWPDRGTDDEQKHAFFTQIGTLDSNYPGGIKGYCESAKALLQAASNGENPMKGVNQCEIPVGFKLNYGDSDFEELEALGLQDASKCAFVLVAGGLGERLGYGSIKVALPTQLTTGWCYLQFYIQNILALQSRCNAARPAGTPEVVLPLAIMVSGDTHDRTLKLLEDNQYFGMRDGQLTLMMQEKVASIQDSQARLCPEDKYSILTKPHGHGDVHYLIHSKGLSKQWTDEGRKYVCFFQDTNGLLFNTLLAAVGVSTKLGLAMNSMCIPRLAGQEIGGLTKLTFDDGRTLVCNTEYNQIDSVLREVTGKGDEADETGKSPFPGNINQLILAMDVYAQVLDETQGVMQEFVNPKYKDETRTAFKKPTRLECMMQDYAKVLAEWEGGKAEHGFTTGADWLNYSPCKNSVEEAHNKIKAGVGPYSACSAEADQYQAVASMWRAHGCAVEEHAEPSGDVSYGIPIKLGPCLVTAPSFAVGSAELKSRLPNPAAVKISTRSTLVIEGEGTVTVESLELDGALVVRAAAGTTVVLRGVTVKNEGYKFVSIGGSTQEALEAGHPEMLCIRGYDLEKVEHACVVSDAAGEYVVTGELAAAAAAAVAVALAPTTPAAPESSSAGGGPAAAVPCSTAAAPPKPPRSKVTLGYWKIRGLAQPIRLLLEHTGMPYEDEQYECGDAPGFDRSAWQSVKFSLGLPFPNLPYLIDGDIRLTQSNAILRHIAEEHGMAGSTPAERATVSMLADCAMDLRNAIVRAVYVEQAQYEQARRNLMTKMVPGMMSRLVKCLDGKDWFASASGSSPTFIDFVLYELMDQLRTMEPGCLDAYPQTTAFLARFEALPKIAAYMASDRFMRRPINNKSAAFF